MDGERNGDGWWVITFVIGVMALVMGVVGIAIASGRSDASSIARVHSAAPSEMQAPWPCQGRVRRRTSPMRSRDTSSTWKGRRGHCLAL